MLAPALLVALAANVPPAERQLLDHVATGEKLWAASCRKPAADGSCVAAPAKVTPEVARCEGSNRRPGPLEVARDQRRAREAGKRFQAAVDLWAKGELLNALEGEDLASRKAALTAAAATAMFRRAEAIYEEFLTLQYPETVDLGTTPSSEPPRRDAKRDAKGDAKRDATERPAGVGIIGILRANEGGYAPNEAIVPPSETPAERRAREAAEKRQEQNRARLTDYVSRKKKLQQEATPIYVDLARLGAAPWDAAAAARVGQMNADFAQQLQNAPLPRDLQAPGADEKLQRAYCGTLKSLAEPLQTAATSAFEHCISKRHPEAPASDWPVLCQTELDRLNPPVPLPPDHHP